MSDDFVAGFLVCVGLLAVIWFAHRRMHRRDAGGRGEPGGSRGVHDDTSTAPRNAGRDPGLAVVPTAV